MTVVMVTITAPEPDWLIEHVHRLVKEGLAASGNVIPAVQSIYQWRGEIHDQAEAFALVQTQAKHVPAIVEMTNTHHPYDTPRVIATNVVSGNPDYLDWVRTQTQAGALEQA